MPTTIIKQTQVENAINSATQTALNTKVNKITSVDNQAVRFDGVTGEVQGSGVTILDNGNVGIGTSTPSNPLSVRNPIALSGLAGDTQPLAEYSGNQANDAYLRIINRQHTTGSADWVRSNLRIQKTIDITPMGFIDFGIDGILADHGIGLGSQATTHMVVLQNGNVGIGTVTPTSKLQVVGLPSYADNASAITGGLTVGAFYHTAGVLKVVI